MVEITPWGPWWNLKNAASDRQNRRGREKASTGKKRAELAAMSVINAANPSPEKLRKRVTGGV